MTATQTNTKGKSQKERGKNERKIKFRIMERRYKCKYCNRTYAMFLALENHEKQCTYKPKKYVCGCWEEINDKGNKIMHLCNEHKLDKTDNFCGLE